ncbi:uncharacterized protein MONBRDRAFT_1680, partial [Monosiga brevicollis MX1]
LLPSVRFRDLWESLVYDGAIQQTLLRYALSILHFSDRGVNPSLVAWNKTILLHGPPGTGKTSLCKALAQKLSILLSPRYVHARLVEINSHSLFSKWFSESGKLVTRLFAQVRELAANEQTLVIILVDEVESLAAARSASVNGSEPSDAVRVVNALLTQIDQLSYFPNVMLLTTSNLAGAVDVAFVDRADLKIHVGPPSLAARYRILHLALSELVRKGIVSTAQQLD